MKLLFFIIALLVLWPISIVGSIFGFFWAFAAVGFGDGEKAALKMCDKAYAALKVRIK